MADVKLETDIVENRLSAVKKKTTHYTFYVVNFPLLRTSCFLNQRFMLCKCLGSWLKRGFKLQYAIEYMLLDTPTVAEDAYKPSQAF